MSLEPLVESPVLSVDAIVVEARQLRAQNRSLDASRLLLSALRSAPASPELYAELGMALFGLGLVERSIKAYEQAVSLRPDHFRYRLNLSGVYHHAGRYEDCIAEALVAAEETPLMGAACMNLGLSYASLKDWTLSANYLERSVELMPEHCGAWLNLGLAYENFCQDDKANACFARAVELEPENHRAWMCLATNNLRRGAFEPGWEQFSSRFDLDPSLVPDGETPLWRGESLVGRTIQLVPEQGLGDLVQFIRFSKTLSELGAKVVATVPEKLKDLLSEVPGIDQCFTDSSLVPPCDYQSTIMELARWLKVDETNIPLAGGYLNPPKLCERLQRDLDECEGQLKVGIAWAGNPNHTNDSRRSMSFQDLEPLLDVEGVQLINLQVCEKSKQLQEHPRGHEVKKVPLDTGAVGRTAALIASLDVVITVDTFVAHLSGALHVPTWVCLAQSPDWRWQTQRSDSPWYESVRLFRQDRSATWQSVGFALADALRELTSHTR